MKRRRYFSVAEVDRLVPRLEVAFARILQAHAELRSAQAALAALGDPATPALLEPEVVLDGNAKARQLKARFRALYEVIAADVAGVEELGGLVKDLEIGLVDFPSLLGGSDEVLLCWRMGEKRLGFWHDAAAGFAGRRPVTGRRFVGAEPAAR